MLTSPSSRPNSVERRGDACVDLVAAAYVALHRQRLDAAGAHLVGGLLDLVQRPAGGDDVRALSGGGERDALTDALPRTGDQHHLACSLPTGPPVFGAPARLSEAGNVRGYLTGRQVIVRRVDLRYSAAEQAFRDELRDVARATSADAAAEAGRRRLAGPPRLRHRLAAPAVRRRLRRHQLAEGVRRPRRDARPSS